MASSHTFAPPTISQHLRRELLVRGKTAGLAHIGLFAVFAWMTGICGHGLAVIASAIVTLSSGSRAAIGIAAMRHPNASDTQLRTWYRVSLPIILLQAGAWGWLLQLTFAAYGTFDTISMMGMLLVTGIVAGATSSMSPDPRLFAAYSLVMFAPPVAMILATADGGPVRVHLLTTLVVMLIFFHTQVRSALKMLVTSLENAELAHASGAAVETVLNAQPGVVAVVDTALVVHRANALGMATFGPELNAGTSLRPLREAPRLASLVQALEQFLASGRDAAQRELEVTAPGVRDPWFVLAMRRVDAPVDGVILVATPNSELKAAQLALSAERARSENASRLAAVGEMAGGIAHEINNPLAIISGYSQQLLRMVRAGAFVPAPPGTCTEHIPPGASLERVAERIDRTVARISVIVKALLVFGRDGNHDPFESADVVAVVRNALDFCQERFRNNGIALTLCTAVEEQAVVCRRVQLVQVLVNLLSNAFDAVQRRARLETDAVRWTRVSISVQDDQIVVAVSDSGLGIELPLRAKLMQPFFTTKEIGAGTGLGLSVAKGIIEAHSGRLRFDEAAVDTTFVVELPRPARRVKGAGGERAA